MTDKFRRSAGRVSFDFDSLPVELKHEVLRTFKTQYLSEVCARVSTHWEGMVQDILYQRQLTVDSVIPPYFRKEVQMRARPEIADNPLEIFKLYEDAMLFKKFDVTAVEVNSDVWASRGGLFYKLQQNRTCECHDISDCIMRSLHLVPAFSLFAIDYEVHGLRFFNLADIEKLDHRAKTNSIVPYTCCNKDGELGDFHTTLDGLSVFGDHILVEEAAKTLLLLKLTYCDHDKRIVTLQRVRRIHLPIWSLGLCLFEDKCVVLYTTGFVGMWNRTKDQLAMSPTKCDLGEIDSRFLHRTKVIRLGTLVLIRANATGSRKYRWFLVDSNDPKMNIYRVNLATLATSGFLYDASNYIVSQVSHIDLWFNCLLIHCNVQSIKSPDEIERHVAFRRIQRYPTVEDFLNPEKFKNEFLFRVASPQEKLVSVILEKGRYAFTSPFIPCSFKPWQLQPPVDEPVPVADLIVLQLTPMNRTLDRNLLKVFRMRMANLPFNYSN